MGGINAEKPHRATLRKCTVSSSSPLPQLPPYITRCIVFFKQQRSWSYQDDITKYESQVVPFISTSSWIKRVLNHWLTSDAKIQPVFTRRKAVAFGFSHHGHSLVTREPRASGHALRPTFILWLLKIWQVSSRGKFMHCLETCLVIAEADSFVSSYSCTKWKTAAIKILLLFMAGLFIGCLVEKFSAFPSHRKSVFWWHRFQIWAST